MNLELAALLDGFRDSEAREDLAVVLDDPAAIRVLAAWRRQSPVWRAPRSKPPEDRGALWMWLWSGVHYDREALAVASKCTEAAAELLLRACVVARVVYPDGSLSGPAEKLIAEHVENRYPGRRKGRPPGARGHGKPRGAARGE